MTTSGDKLKDQVNREGTQALQKGVNPDQRGDPTGTFPNDAYVNQSSINKAMQGKTKHQLGGTGGSDAVKVEQDFKPPEVGFVQVKETLSGHVLEFDDTKGQERILLKHQSGAGVEMRPDGGITVTTKSHRVTIINGSEAIRVEGTATIEYAGDLNVDVAGDYNLTVRGNMNTAIKGDQFVACENNTFFCEGSSNDTVKGTRFTNTLKNAVDMALGDRDIVTKGNFDMATAGEQKIASTGNLKLSSEDTLIGAATTQLQMGSPKINMTAAQGTYGGETVTMYAQNLFATSATFTEGVTAPTFHGDLKGVAEDAATSQHQSYSDGSGPGYSPSVGSQGTITNTPTNTDQTFKPTAGLMGQYNEGLLGPEEVKIDPSDHFKNAYDRSTATGGVTDKDLSIEQVRSKLKDPANLKNEDFVAEQIARGTLNPEYVKPTPEKTSRTASSAPTAREVYNIGPGTSTREASGTKVKTRTNTKNLSVDPLYNVMDGREIKSNTEIGRGITIAKFIGGKGDGANLNHITVEADRYQLARNLTIQAQAMATVDDDQQWNGYRLVVDEGIYKPSPNEKVTAGSINELAQNGRAIAYKLYNNAGKVDQSALFDLALYWKDNLLYDEIIVDYDNFHPDTKKDVDFQLIFVIPNISNDWKASFKRNLKTNYNGNPLSQGELIEVGQDPFTSFNPSSSGGGYGINASSKNPILFNTEGTSYMLKPNALKNMKNLLENQYTKMQDIFGGPIQINDGLAKAGTTRERNTPNSQHFNGTALDLSTAGMSNADKGRLFQAAKSAGFKGFGFGSTILHVDLGARRSWSYRNTQFAGQPVSYWKSLV